MELINGKFAGEKGKTMIRNVKFVEPAKVYRMIKRELDEAYLEVMEESDCRKIQNGIVGY
ncbi:MAG: hypothetical protein C0399_11835 [Syntrophus sp. (in: bacteria)]|nr:hypothetical protein [Syntrophus sp. (in: bacteria)]